MLLIARCRYWMFYYVTILLQSSLYIFKIILITCSCSDCRSSRCLWKNYLPTGLRRHLPPSQLQSDTWLPCHVHRDARWQQSVKLRHLEQSNIQVESWNSYKVIASVAGSHVGLPEITVLDWDLLKSIAVKLSTDKKNPHTFLSLPFWDANPSSDKQWDFSFSWIHNPIYPQENIFSVPGYVFTLNLLWFAWDTTQMG